MASPFSSNWFSRLAPADAARFVVVLERVRQGNWLLPVRTSAGQLGLRLGDLPDELFVFGTPDQNIGAAIRLLHRKMSPLIFRRLRDDRTFGSVVLLEAVRALLDNDVALTKGLLRRFVDTNCGFAQLAEIAEGHPKSLIRMLGPNGNPSARRLLAILTLLADLHGVRFNVELGPHCDRSASTTSTRAARAAGITDASTAAAASTIAAPTIGNRPGVSTS